MSFQPTGRYFQQDRTIVSDRQRFLLDVPRGIGTSTGAALQSVCNGTFVGRVVNGIEDQDIRDLRADVFALDVHGIPVAAMFDVVYVRKTIRTMTFTEEQIQDVESVMYALNGVQIDVIQFK